MRNIHAKLISEYGQESVKILRWWEKLELKMARLPKSPEVHSEMPKSKPDSSQHKAQDHSEDSQRYIHNEEG